LGSGTSGCDASSKVSVLDSARSQPHPHIRSSTRQHHLLPVATLNQLLKRLNPVVTPLDQNVLDRLLCRSSLCSTINVSVPLHSNPPSETYWTVSGATDISPLNNCLAGLITNEARDGCAREWCVRDGCVSEPKMLSYVTFSTYGIHTRMPVMANSARVILVSCCRLRELPPEGIMWGDITGLFGLPKRKADFSSTEERS